MKVMECYSIGTVLWYTRIYVIISFNVWPSKQNAALTLENCHTKCPYPVSCGSPVQAVDVFTILAWNRAIDLICIDITTMDIASSYK